MIDEWKQGFTRGFVIGLVGGALATFAIINAEILVSRLEHRVCILEHHQQHNARVCP